MGASFYNLKQMLAAGKEMIICRNAASYHSIGDVMAFLIARATH
jgi:hypothetical protein